ncbi:MAG: CinA family protein [Oscillospiraceae bacterium]|nr:CinA family protein [Oscillospiraceae bacterium]
MKEIEDIEEINAKSAALAKQLVELCAERGLKVSTAESCTGGLVSASITSVSGSSSVIELGICSYSNRIKREVLGVSEKTLEEFSEYSAECAEEMAAGAMRISSSDLAVSTTGVAGPGGGTDKHPVGEVYIGICSNGSCKAKRFLFSGSREQIRARTVFECLKMLVFSVNDYNSHDKI